MFKNSYFLVWIVKKLALYSLRLVLFLLSWFIFYLIQYVVAWFHQVICPVRPVLRLASLLHFRRLFFNVYFPQMFLFQHSCLERNFGFFCVFFICVFGFKSGSYSDDFACCLCTCVSQFKLGRIAMLECIFFSVYLFNASILACVHHEKFWNWYVRELIWWENEHISFFM